MKNKIENFFLDTRINPNCICCFGGPGSGKSTTTGYSVAGAKMFGIDVELLGEVAKKKVYENNLEALKDQSSITGEQIKDLNTLIKSKQLSVVIQDSPFILGIVYQSNEDPHVDVEEFERYHIDKYLRYQNINIFLKREKNASYQESGRIQTLNESIKIDNDIKDLLLRNDLPYIDLPAYEATQYIIEVTKIMDKMMYEDRKKIYDQSMDLKEYSLGLHIYVIRKVIESISKKEEPINIVARRLDLPIDVVRKINQELNNIEKNETGITKTSLSNMKIVLEFELERLLNIRKEKKMNIMGNI